MSRNQVIGFIALVCHRRTNVKAANDTAATELTLEELRETFDFIRGCSDRQYKRTPLLTHWIDFADCAEVSRRCDLYIKLENMQVTGDDSLVSFFRFGSSVYLSFC